MKNCIACAEEIKLEAKLCKFCKTIQSESSPTIYEPGSNPQGVPLSYEINLSRAKPLRTEVQISEKLKGYERLTNLECLVCLYKGTMGQTDSRSDKRTRTLVVVFFLLFILLFTPGFLVAIIAGAIIGTLVAFAPRPAVCPNCDSVLKKQSIF